MFPMLGDALSALSADPNHTLVVCCLAVLVGLTILALVAMACGGLLLVYKTMAYIRRSYPEMIRRNI